MSTVKRLGLVASMVVLGTLFAASPSLAGRAPKPVSSTYQLNAPETDPPEPGASGQYTLTSYPNVPLAGVQVEVSCRRVASGNQYVVVVLEEWRDLDSGGSFAYEDRRTFTADTQRRLKCEFSLGGWPGTSMAVFVQDLWIENDEGSVVLETER